MATRIALQAEITEQKSHLKALRKLELEAKAIVRKSIDDKPWMRSKRTQVLLRLVLDISESRDQTLAISRRLFARWWSDLSDTKGATTHAFFLSLNSESIVSRAEHLRRQVVVPKIVQRAVRIVAEWRVLQQIAKQNRKGLYPWAHEILLWLENFWPVHYQHNLRQPFVSRLKNNRILARRFCRKLRHAWMIAYSKLPTKTAVPPEVQTSRVYFFVNSGPKKQPNSGTQIWGHFWYPNLGTSLITDE